jgi:transposase
MHIMPKPVVSPVRRRRAHSEEFKRELVELCLEPGVSVAAIAMAHGINANLLFGWRRRHLEASGQRESVAPATPPAVLLPVSINTTPCEAQRAPLPSVSSTRPSTGTIEIEIAGVHVRLRGPVDDASLRVVLSALRDTA